MKILKIHVQETKKSISDLADTIATNTFPTHSEDNQRRGDGEGAGQTGERQRQCEKGWYCEERSFFP